MNVFKKEKYKKKCLILGKPTLRIPNYKVNPDKDQYRRPQQLILTMIYNPLGLYLA